MRIKLPYTKLNLLFVIMFVTNNKFSVQVQLTMSFTYRGPEPRRERVGPVSTPQLQLLLKLVVVTARAIASYGRGICKCVRRLKGSIP